MSVEKIKSWLDSLDAIYELIDGMTNELGYLALYLIPISVLLIHLQYPSSFTYYV
ncbi:MAG: hypothetical protein ACFFD3_05080 [Candidatus Thorarchaeota archaeon]